MFCLILYWENTGIVLYCRRHCQHQEPWENHLAKFCKLHLFFLLQQYYTTILLCLYSLATISIGAIHA